MNAHATMLLLSVSGNRILLAADGMGVHPGSAQPYFTHCKITQQGDSFYAIAQLEDYPATRFSVPTIVAKTWKQGRDFWANVAEFEHAIDDPLHATWEYIKKNDRKLLPYFPGPVLDIIFVGKPAGRLTAVIVGFQEVSGRWRENPRQVFTGDFVKAPTYTTDGDWRFGVAYLNSHPEIRKLDDVEFFRRLLKGAIGLQPTDGKLREIGEPISILEVPDNGGAHWVDQGACLDIRTVESRSPRQQSPKKK